jgi:hypothetical protein
MFECSDLETRFGVCAYVDISLLADSMSPPQANNFGMQHSEDGLNSKAIKHLYSRLNLSVIDLV